MEDPLAAEELVEAELEDSPEEPADEADFSLVEDPDPSDADPDEVEPSDPEPLDAVLARESLR